MEAIKQFTVFQPTGRHSAMTVVISMPTSNAMRLSATRHDTDCRSNKQRLISLSLQWRHNERDGPVTREMFPFDDVIMIKMLSYQYGNPIVEIKHRDIAISIYYTGRRHSKIETDFRAFHYRDVLMGAKASQITSFTIVYSTVYSGTNQRKHQRSALLAFVIGIHRWPVNSPHMMTSSWSWPN